jgi:hypothetical protein
MPDFGGLFDVTSHGARANGTDDVTPALRDLAKTIPASGGTMYFPPGEYALGADLVVPRNVALDFPNGARLIARRGAAPTLTIRGEIRAGAHQIFGEGVTVRFTAPNQTGTNTRTALLADVLPEWWGARGDGATDDTLALQSCIDACCGAPFESFTEPVPPKAVLPTTKGPPRWATARMRLGAGAVYKVTKPLHVVSVVGFSITGAGLENSIIRSVGIAAGKATAGSATTLTKSGAKWKDDELRGMWVCITEGAAAGQSSKVAGNISGKITLAHAITPAPDASSTFVVLPESVLDLDGCFEGSFDRFSVEGGSGAGAYTDIYYHRDPALTARGSSSTNFAFVKVGGLTWEAAWQIGGLGDSYDPWQEDITEFHNCRARGAGGPSYGGQYYRNGWVFGTGTFANNLNHVIHGIDAVSYGYNVSVRATNVAIYGGTVQSAGIADFQVVHGLQGYLVVSGIRSEESRKLFDYSYNPYSVFWSVRLSDIEVSSPRLVANGTAAGGGDVITTGAHYTELSGIRVLNPPTLSKQSTSSASRTTITRQDARWTPHQYAGWSWIATAGTGKGQTADVADNTANTLTFSAPLAIAPDDTTTWDIFLRPVIKVTKDGTMLRLNGVALAGGTIDKSIVVTAHAVTGVRVVVEGFAEVTHADAIVSTLWQGPIILGPPGEANGAALMFGEIGLRPDSRISRTAPGTLSTGALGVTGTLLHGGIADARLGFFGAKPIARPRVTGGSTAEALKNLLDSLAQLGLISDGTK